MAGGICLIMWAIWADFVRVIVRERRATQFETRSANCNDGVELNLGFNNPQEKHAVNSRDFNARDR
jgi:hypothetical protein